MLWTVVHAWAGTLGLQLLDELLKEEHVMDVMGCLEYDPDLQVPQQHRTFLQTAVVFKEVVPITSQVGLAEGCSSLQRGCIQQMCLFAQRQMGMCACPPAIS